MNFSNIQALKTLPFDLVENYDRKNPVLIILPDQLWAHYLEDCLNYFLNDTSIYHFCDREVLPYDQYSPHPDLAASRMRTLLEISNRNQNTIIITDAHSISQRLCPRTYPDSFGIHLSIGSKLDQASFVQRLLNAGYSHNPFIAEKGEFAQRGAIVDLFPLGAKNPYRIEWFDDEIDSIRSFDVQTQSTIEKLQEVSILPKNEVDLSEKGRVCFRQNARQIFGEGITKSGVYKAISQGHSAQSIEYYLPLFFDETSTLFEYLPKKTQVICAIGVENLEKNAQYYRRRYERLNPFRENTLLPPEYLLISPEDCWSEIENLAEFKFRTKSKPLDLTGNNKERQELWSAEITKAQKNKKTVHIHFLSKGQREQYLAELHRKNISAQIIENYQQISSDYRKIQLHVCDVQYGVSSEKALHLAFSELSASPASPKKPRREHKDAGEVIASLQDIKSGDLVVHSDYGIGRFLRLEKIEDDEMILIEYAKGAKLFVAIRDLDLISKYAGVDCDDVNLSVLGSKTWLNNKKKIKQQISDTAVELLKLYAAREASQSKEIIFDQSAMEELAASFPYPETADQTAAIEAVLSDLKSPKPMDRIVCGDVGFGKTEVAIRAAYAAVLAGMQVVLLTPTTLLCEQHFQSFSDRLSDFAVKIETLSRFKSTSQQKDTIENLRTGRCDIVIATHRILQKDISFKRLGLVIIDEEQRFGVKHKEKLKNLRNDANFLTLTATPIPRTMNLTMSGLRDLSLIATAPQGRQSVQTNLISWDLAQIEEACEREIRRGGQVFFLHNEVASIERIARTLAEILPQARIAIAHGQMSERQLDQIMQSFYNHHYDILVATTIIESGIDIPNANTILINRADKLGLSQMHQLRGRVGRSHHKAYAYLITPDLSTLNKDAQRRLEAFISVDSLGAGFILAGQDMEIRGAGEILGEEQTGQMSSIGVNYYLELLDKAIKLIKTGKNKQEIDTVKPEIDLGLVNFIPDSYIPDPQQRLKVYMRIAKASTYEQLEEIKVKLIEKYGVISQHQAVDNLFALHRLSIFANDIGIKEIKANATGSNISLSFWQENKIDPQKLALRLQDSSNKCRFLSQNSIQIMISNKTENFVEKIHNFLDSISE